jgi:type II secretory pathway pseudopilin PulG
LPKVAHRIAGLPKEIRIGNPVFLLTEERMEELMPEASKRFPVQGRTSRGLTLLEVLLAVLILALAVFSLTFNLTHLLVGIRQNKQGLLAKAAAEREMERRSGQSLSKISALCPSTTFTPTADGISAIPGATGQILVCDYNPTDGSCSGCGASRIKKVTVKVNLGSQRVYRLTSLLTDWTAGLASATNSYYPPS